MYLHNYVLHTNEPNENNKLQPITTVFVDHVLPKIELEIEHVLIGVENRSLFRMTHVSKVGSDFRLPKIGAGFRPRVYSWSKTSSCNVGLSLATAAPRRCE